MPREVLRRLLHDRDARPDVLIGPGIGRDAAVLDVEDTDRLVAASDPITFATDEIGWYAVHVNANDVACMGASPRWFLATVLLPYGANEALVERIFTQIETACDEVDAVLVGGHTETATGIDRPLVCGTMLGTAAHTISAADARPGDALLLTKALAVEATALIARERGARLADAVGEDALAEAREFLREPGISVVPDAHAALLAGPVRAMHDPTEGGLGGAVHELCAASETGARLNEASIPVYPLTRALTEPFGIDPLGVLASGALLIAVPPGAVEETLSAMAAAGITCAEIGELTDAAAGIRLVDPSGVERPLPEFMGDEIAKIY